jgi:hypothetical protein
MLAVVGGVVGAIWYAAAKFYEDYKVSKTVEEIFSTARNIQNLISIRDAEMIGQLTVITPELMSAGVFPKDWVDGNTLKNPFGGNILIQNFVPSDPRFDFRLYKIPRSACIKLLVKISSIGLMAGANGSGQNNRSALSYLQNYPHWSTTTFPVSPATAVEACNSVNITIVATFSYTRINN